MKHLFLIFALVIPFLSIGQNRSKKERITTEYQQNMQEYELPFTLDLSKNQTGKIQSLFEQQVSENRRNKNNGKLSSNQRYSMELKYMNRQVAIRAHMKENQYKEWKKIQLNNERMGQIKTTNPIHKQDNKFQKSKKINTKD
jgi:DNA polymerase III epsilon subunit-like protein